MNFNEEVKTIITDIIKSHNEYEGKIIEFYNHIYEANKIFYSLPINLQNEIGQLILSRLAANGVVVIKPQSNN